MWQRLSIAGLLVTLSGCVQSPPLAGDADARRFEAVPERAVIYVARQRLDLEFVAPVMLDGQMLGATYRGTYIRVVVPGGMHSIAGYAGDGGLIRLQAEAGRVYFITQVTYGWSSLAGSRFKLVDAEFGRSVVLGGTMVSEFVR
jgi:hypothetical protein